MPVVEHTFVTTMDAARTFDAAGRFLSELGFREDPAEENDSRSFRRGRHHPGYATRFRDLPQYVRLDYDRGRVSIAASMLLEGKQRDRLALNLIMALATGLEHVLAHQQSTLDARTEWDGASQAIDRRTIRRRRWAIGCSVAFVLLIAGVILMAVLSSPQKLR